MKVVAHVTLTVIHNLLLIYKVGLSSLNFITFLLDLSSCVPRADIYIGVQVVRVLRQTIEFPVFERQQDSDWGVLLLKHLCCCVNGSSDTFKKSICRYWGRMHKFVWVAPFTEVTSDHSY